MIAKTLAGDSNTNNAFKVWVGINDESGTQDTSTDMKSYTATHDVSTKGSFTGISLAGTVYNFDPVLDGDDLDKLRTEIEGAIVDAGYSFESGDVEVSKDGNEVTVTVYPSSLVFTAMVGASSNTTFTAANSEKMDAVADDFQTYGYKKK
jgi:hypothetical protein